MGSESPDVVLYDSNGNALAVQNATATPASTPALMVAGSDGTNSRYLVVDSSGRLTMVGAGTAGTPAGGVVSIQGVASGTAVPISGSVSITGTTAVTQSTSPWVDNVTQFGGTNISTGTGASGAGIPRVTVSNDSNILATQSGTWTVQQGTPPWSFSDAQTTEATAAWTSSTSVNTALQLNVSGYGTVAVTLNQGSTITGGVVTFEVSDTSGGTNWYSLSMVQTSGATVPGSTYTFVQSTNTAFQMNVAGFVLFRVRLSTVISGTGTVNVGIIAQASAAEWQQASYITDATHGPVAVKAASTAAVATDPALVVAVSPNNTVAVTQSTSPWVGNISQFGGNNVVTGTGASGVGIPRVTVSNDSNILATQSGTWTVQPGNTQNTTPWSTSTLDVTASGTLGALNAAVTLAVTGEAGAGFQLSAGTLIGTIVPEVSTDGGTTWVQSFFINANNGIQSASSVFPIANVAQTAIIYGMTGASHVRVRVSAYTSGTANAALRGSAFTTRALLSETLVGAAAPNSALQMGGTDGSNIRALSTDSSGRQLVIGAAAAGSAPAGNPLYLGMKSATTGNIVGSLGGSEGSFGVSIMTNEVVVQTNATVTTSGSQIISGSFYGVQQINLVVNVKATPTGTSPTLTYTIQEVDPGDNATTFGNSTSTSAISAIGVYTATLTTTTSSSVKVSWTIAGTTPSFTQVYATVVSKATPSSQATTSSPSSATSGFSTGNVTVSATTITAVLETTYTEQSANFTGSVVSSNANDTSAGTGARTITITYYDSSGNGPYTETATMNGTTAVNLVNTNHCFIEKIVVVTVGSNATNAGTISLFTGSAGGGTLVGTIAIGDNRTFWCHHYVANGKTCSITDLVGGTSGSKNASFWLRSLSIPTANQAEVQVTDTLRLATAAPSTVREYGTPIKVSGPARIRAYITSDGTSTATFFTSFTFFDQ